jgi:hypothetical protein
MDFLRKKNDQCRLYRFAFHYSPAGICLISHPDFEILEINRSFTEMVCDGADVKGKLFSSVWEKTKERDILMTGVVRNGVFGWERLKLKGPGDSGRVYLVHGIMFDDSYIMISVKIPEGPNPLQ